MSWKAILFILSGGVVFLVIWSVYMQKNQQKILFNSAGYALEQLYHDINTKNDIGYDFKLKEWQPYLKATPHGRLPSFVKPTDIFIATHSINYTNSPDYLIAIKIGENLFCVLQSNGICTSIDYEQFLNWPHKIFSQHLEDVRRASGTNAEIAN